MFGWPVVRIETEKRRLEVLRYLTVAPGYEATAQVLRLHCNRVGVPTASDHLIAALAWLEEHHLVTLRRIGDEPIVRVTSNGREVADGLTLVPGVLRPDP